MGQADDAFDKFVDDIPDSKLAGFSSQQRTLISTKDFRVDMQGLTTTEIRR